MVAEEEEEEEGREFVEPENVEGTVEGIVVDQYHEGDGIVLDEGEGMVAAEYVALVGIARV